MLSSNYFKINKDGISPIQTMAAYLGGSAIQTTLDNPITAYRQLVQQYAKNLNGNVIDPKLARQEANKAFMRSPIGASTSGLAPRLIGVGFKRIPKFGFLLLYSYAFEGGHVGMGAATVASILSAPFINPIRMIEKQQRAFYRQTGTSKPILDILKESAAKNYKPLFRGTVPLMGHSLASATTGLVGQPKLQKYIKQELGTKTGLGTFATGLIASAIVSPVYVMMTNPLSRLEVIMQTASIKGEPVSLGTAVKEVVADTKRFGMRGMFRGQGIGIVKAIISLTLFHQGRIFLTDCFKTHNSSMYDDE